ncbi:MAG: phosphoribosylanthranilate isomerase [Deltaproteobacteria bacterium]|nr:phosphoribosylanthranilate isomerase [Deltaproteobacteria bacterium]
MWVKICGITSLEDAEMAVEAGVDALGLNFFARSPRSVSVEQAKAIIRAISEPVEWVGIFVNESPVRIQELAKELPLDWVQLHGDEDRLLLEQLRGVQRIKAIRVQTQNDLEQIRAIPAEAYLLESLSSKYGGTGKEWNWEWGMKWTPNYRIILSGGLKPENVGEVIQKVRPYGVDVCSGVEASPGKKDREKVFRFVKEGHL